MGGCRERFVGGWGLGWSSSCDRVRFVISILDSDKTVVLFFRANVRALVCSSGGTRGRFLGLLGEGRLSWAMGSDRWAKKFLSSRGHFKACLGSQESCSLENPAQATRNCSCPFISRRSLIAHTEYWRSFGGAGGGEGRVVVDCARRSVQGRAWGRDVCCGERFMVVGVRFTRPLAFTSLLSPVRTLRLGSKGLEWSARKSRSFSGQFSASLGSQVAFALEYPAHLTRK